VVVEEPAAFESWLKAQPTFAASMRPAPASSAGGAETLVARGQALAQSRGCVACHSVDGSAGVGPTWKGLFGKTETLADGSTARVDEAFLKGEIREPQTRLVKGFPPVMPKLDLSDEDVAALVDYIRSKAQ
jgi:cytochrome c oxidase subunit 2